MGCRGWRERAVLLLSLAIVPAVSHAQEVEQDQQQELSCRCLLPHADPSQAVGEVSSVVGDVAMTQTTGYSGPVAGAPILQGSVIRVGLNSSVSLRFQDMCFIEAPSTSTVSVQPVDSGVCVAVNEPPKPVEPPVETGGTNMGIVAAAAGVTAAAVGVAIGLGSGDDDDDDKEPASR